MFTIAGTTSSTNFPTTPGVEQTALKGSSSDAFVAKLNSTGTSLVYSTYLGGSGERERQWHCGGLFPGTLILPGSTSSAGLSTIAGSFQTVPGGGSNDAFITKLSPNATSLVYSSFPGEGRVRIWCKRAVDASGEAL